MLETEICSRHRLGRLVYILLYQSLADTEQFQPFQNSNAEVFELQKIRLDHNAMVEFKGYPRMTYIPAARTWIRLPTLYYDDDFHPQHNAQVTFISRADAKVMACGVLGLA